MAVCLRSAADPAAAARGRAHHRQHADAELSAALALRPQYLSSIWRRASSARSRASPSRRRFAIPLGLLVGRFRAVREFVDPVIRSLYPIPGIAWIPLAILWFGLGNTAVIFVVFIAEFFPLYFNTEAGARNINPILVDAARCFGAKRLTLLRRVILPASIPYIITGMRIALGGAWRMIVAGEMLASTVRHRLGSDGIALPVPRHRSDDGDDPDQRGRLRHRAADRRHAREEDHGKVGSENSFRTNAPMHAISKIIARHADRKGSRSARSSTSCPITSC